MKPSRPLFWPCLIALVTPLSAQPASSQSAPGQSAPGQSTSGQPELGEAQDAVIPIYLSGRRPLAILRIANRPPVPVVFDTGTSGNGVDKNFATRANLRQTGVAQITDGRTGTVMQGVNVVFDHARLSGFALGSPEAAAYPFVEEDAVGIIGPNLFAGALVYLELDRGRIRLRPKSTATLPSGPSQPYVDQQDGGGLPGIDVELPGGLKVAAVLDSGNTAPLALPRAMASRLPLESPPAVVGKATSVSGTSDILGAKVRGTVKIGTVVLQDPEVVFMDHTNVGLPIIRQLRIVLDPEQRRSWGIVPRQLSGSEISGYEGQAGDLTFRASGKDLLLERQGRSALRLKYLGEDLFENPATGMQYQFDRDGDRAIALKTIGTSGIVRKLVWTGRKPSAD